MYRYVCSYGQGEIVHKLMEGISYQSSKAKTIKPLFYFFIVVILFLVDTNITFLIHIMKKVGFLFSKKLYKEED